MFALIINTSSSYVNIGDIFEVTEYRLFIRESGLHAEKANYRIINSIEKEGYILYCEEIILSNSKEKLNRMRLLL